jgi:ribokinase
MPPARICVVGSVNIDLTFRTSRMPRPGETLTATGFQISFGGKGANQAVMASRLGAKVALVARVGSDLFGTQSLDNLRSQGIDAQHVATDNGHATGVAGITVDGQGQNCILLAPGANQRLSEADVNKAAATIGTANILLGQLEVPIATTLAAFRIARTAGVTTILNPAPAQPPPRELLELTDLLVPNESELESLTGGAAASIDEIEIASRLLLTTGPRQLIVTLGARGALLVTPQSATHVAGLPVQAHDTTGAGDAFIGSLAGFWAEGMALLDAVKRANAAAALSVTRPGTQASYPTCEDVDAVL